jgi:hypothetical protein
MKSTLYIFATSARPDAYVNSIAHLASQQELGKVQIVVVAEHDYPRDEEEADLATEVLASILDLLKALSQGVYPKRQKDGSTSRVALPDRSYEIYAKCLDTLNKQGNGCLSISYSDLERRLVELSKEDCLFDLSALKKHLLVDVVATLIAHNFSRVRAFELHKAPTFDERDLYHNLRKEDFIYRNLAKSPLINSSLKHIRRWSTRSQLFLILTVVLTGILILIRTIAGVASPLMDYMNGAAVVASIASFLFQFIPSTHY